MTIEIRALRFDDDRTTRPPSVVERHRDELQPVGFRDDEVDLRSVVALVDEDRLGRSSVGERTDVEIAIAWTSSSVRGHTRLMSRDSSEPTVGALEVVLALGDRRRASRNRRRDLLQTVASMLVFVCVFRMLSTVYAGFSSWSICGAVGGMFSSLFSIHSVFVEQGHVIARSVFKVRTIPLSRLATIEKVWGGVELGMQKSSANDSLKIFTKLTPELRALLGDARRVRVVPSASTFE